MQGKHYCTGRGWACARSTGHQMVLLLEVTSLLSRFLKLATLLPFSCCSPVPHVSQVQAAA